MSCYPSYCNENEVPRDPNEMESFYSSDKHPEHRSEGLSPVPMNLDFGRKADMSTVSLSPIEDMYGRNSPIGIGTLLDIPMGEIDIPSTEDLRDSNHGGIKTLSDSRHKAPLRNHPTVSTHTHDSPSIQKDNGKSSSRSRHNSNESYRSISSERSNGGDVKEAPPSSGAAPHPSVHPQHYPPHTYMPSYGAPPPHAAYPPHPYGHYHPHMPPYYPPPGAPPMVPPTLVSSEETLKDLDAESPTTSAQAHFSSASDPKSSTPATTKAVPAVTPAAPSHAPAVVHPAGYPHPSAWPYPGATPHYPHAAMYPPHPGYPHPMIHPMYHPGSYYNYPPAPVSAPVPTKRKEKKLNKVQDQSIRLKEEAHDSIDKTSKPKKEENKTPTAQSETNVAPSSTVVLPPPHVSMPPAYHIYPHPPHPHAVHPHPLFPPHVHGLPPAGPYTACQRTLELARRREKAKRSKRSKKDRPRKSSKSSRLHSKAIFRSKSVVKNEFQDSSSHPKTLALQLSVIPSSSSNVPIHVPVPTRTFSEQGAKSKVKLITCKGNENCHKDTKTENVDSGKSSSGKDVNGPTKSNIHERRARKNCQSRQRAAKLKDRIANIIKKDPSERTEEEKSTLELYEQRRERKNGRSRERAIERKRKMDLIMTKPESEWTKEEQDFIDETMIAKYKKNEGDRLRRKKLKETRNDSGTEGFKTTARSTSRSRRGLNGNEISAKISNVMSQDECNSEPYQDFSGITLDNDDGELDLVQAFKGSIENMWNDETNQDRLSPTFMLFKDGDMNEEQMDAPFLTPKKTSGVHGASSPAIFGSGKGAFNNQQNFVLPTPPASHRQIDSMLNGGGMLSTTTILSGFDDNSDTGEWPANLMVPFSNGSKDLRGGHQLSSPIRTSPLNLPRRPLLKMSHQQTFERRNNSMSKDRFNEHFRGGSYGGHSTEPIAVSFSVDTA